MIIVYRFKWSYCKNNFLYNHPSLGITPHRAAMTNGTFLPIIQSRICTNAYKIVQLSVQFTNTADSSHGNQLALNLSCNIYESQNKR